jgi:hypothetical protein
VKIHLHELEASGLVQALVPEKNLMLEAVRPHLYRHNWPTGSLKVQVLDSDDNVLAESASVDIEDIGSQNFFHGYVRFLVNVGLVKDETYKFKIVGEDGYSFDESAYIGVCTDYDLRKYEPQETPAGGIYAPLDLELWVRSTR